MATYRQAHDRVVDLERRRENLTRELDRVFQHFQSVGSSFRDIDHRLRSIEQSLAKWPRC